MNVAIKTGRELGAGARELIEAKFATFERHLGADARVAHLVCEVEESIATVRAGSRYKVHGTLSVNGAHYHAEALNETVEGAVDRVRDELSTELSHARGRRKGLVRRGGARVKRWLRFGS